MRDGEKWYLLTTIDLRKTFLLLYVFFPVNLRILSSKIMNFHIALVRLFELAEEGQTPSAEESRHLKECHLCMILSWQFVDYRREMQSEEKKSA